MKPVPDFVALKCFMTTRLLSMLYSCLFLKINGIFEDFEDMSSLSRSLAMYFGR